MSNSISQTDNPERSTSLRRGSGRQAPKLPRGKACVGCRERKVRCDGREPVCLVCERAGRICNFSSTKMAPAPGSTAALDARLSSLEKRMRQLSELNPESDNDDGYEDEDEDPILGRSGENGAGLGASLHFSPANTMPLGSNVEEISFNECRPFIDVFFREYKGCCFILSHERFYNGISCTDPKQRPHSALVYAMTLVGIGLSMWPAGSSQQSLTAPKADVLLHLARKHLNDSLANADRLLDHLQASELLALWLFRQGRLQESQYMTATNARLTVSYRLHQIDQLAIQEYIESHPNSAPSVWDGSLLGRPTSSYELGYRISIFWQAYYLDKLLSITTGLLSAYNELSSNEQITTPWLRDMHEYESGHAWEIPYSSLATLTHLDALELSPAEPIETFPLKAISMLYRSTNVLVDPFAPEPYPAIDSMRVLQSAAMKLLDQLTSFSKRSHPQTSNSAQDLIADRVISVAECMLLVTIINIHQAAESLPEPVWDQDRSRAVQVDSARKIVTKSKYLTDGKPPYVVSGFMLSPACRVLKEHSQRIRALGWDDSLSGSGLAPVSLDDVEKDLSTGISMLTWLAESFPVLVVQLEKVRSC